jgi:hypothetical protein
MGCFFNRSGFAAVLKHVAVLEPAELSVEDRQRPNVTSDYPRPAADTRRSHPRRSHAP